MALDKNGMDLKAIARDQKLIDALPNHGRTKFQATKNNTARTKALDKKKGNERYVSLPTGGRGLVKSAENSHVEPNPYILKRKD